MEAINASALTNPNAMVYARRVERDLTNGLNLMQALELRAVPDNLMSDVRCIIDAICGGWFAIPRGLDLTYSASQFPNMRGLSERAPWLLALQHEALAFEAKRALMTSGLSYNLWIQRIPSFVDEAKAASHRLLRLPIEHKAGEITLSLWVQILEDTQATVIHLRNQMSCLSPQWMWNANGPLDKQIQRLKDFGCLSLTKLYISTTRNRCLDRFESRLLEDLMYRGLSATDYIARLNHERQRVEDVANARWTHNYSLIKKAAAILDSAPSYHQGTLSRRLKLESNGAFVLQRSTLHAKAFSIEIRHHFEIGQKGIESIFMLVNYCLALADEVEDARPTFLAYLDCCMRALSRAKDLVETVTLAAAGRTDKDSGGIELSA